MLYEKLLQGEECLSVVGLGYVGMPMAVAKAGLADGVYDLDEIGRYLAELG